MGEDNNPQVNLQHPSWRFSNMNSGSNNLQFDVRPQNFNSVIFPATVSPYGCIFTANAATALSGVYINKLAQTMPPLIPYHKPSELARSDMRHLVFDQLRDRRSFIFTSSAIPLTRVDSVKPVIDQQGSNDTNISIGHGAEEMHENTEEIDALLYSDSDYDQDEEETSTGHSPAAVTERGSSNVATSSLLPAKRRRVDVEHEPDASLVDTASSQVFHCPEVPGDHENKEDNDVVESSCIKRMDHDHNEDRQLKRARIRETVGILRRIIPGGKRKDAVTVLDEAISYLKSLKLKAKYLKSSC